MFGFASSGSPSAPSLNPSPRFSMPKWSSNEWFSIINTTMCSICGIVSVPTGNFGFGRDPGFRTGCGVAASDRARLGGGLTSDFGEAPTLPAAYAANAPPAATAPSPFRTERRLSAMYSLLVSPIWSSMMAPQYCADCSKVYYLESPRSNEEPS